MFSMKIVDTDAFLDMPQSSQLLYYSLAMRADDDGFVSSPKKIMKIVGSNDDDYKLLIAKKFIIPFESGVCVIKHWLIHNLIRPDRYSETQYTREKSLIIVDKKTKKYSLNTGQKQDVIPNGNQMATKWQPNGNQTLPQVRLGKVRLGKVKEIQGLFIPDWIDKKVWRDWENYRRDIKKKLTQTSVNLQVKLLEANKKDHVAIIERSIQNSWTGLFPLGGDKKPANALPVPKGKYDNI